MRKFLKEAKVTNPRILSVFLVLLTVVVTTFSPLLSPLHVHAFEEYPEEILVDLDMAQSSLDELLSQKDIYALVYLCDTYELKSSPDTLSDTVVSLNSGHYVQITGVTQDDYYYIWYEISADVAGSTYTGYILRDYLAYSDEDLLNWEYDNVMSLSFSLFSLAPIAEEDLDVVTIPKDIQQFPESYQAPLLALKQRHPNWNFVRMNTNLDWNYVITEENKGDRSLIRATNPSYLWTKIYDKDKSWAYPTNGFLAHYIDPRCFLTEEYIFQFESLFYNETYHTEAAVQSILDNTFMKGAIPDDENGLTYAKAFYQIGSQLDVSPFHLAARVRQEQGPKGTSDLISGTVTDYNGAYKGVYNYFNVKASGNSDAAIIENGLKHAKDQGWTTRYASLLGGSQLIANDYISTGQFTLYLQKFNVASQSHHAPFTHQYMQAIGAPANEATSIRTSYVSTYSLDKPFTFAIPVYNNMPENPCPVPTAAKELILGKTSYTLKADETAQMTFCLDGLVTNGSAITFSSSNPEVASVSSQGVITAGNAGTATITCTANGAAPVTCSVTVNKTTPVITIPTLNAVTYSPTQKLADINLPEGWAWDNASITPTVTNAGYPATYTPSNTNKYEVTQATLSLTVNKGTPKYEIPQGLEAVEGNVLGSLKLPVGFAWADATVVLDKTDSYPATYNPDEANFETVTGIMIPITVEPLEVECTEHTYGEWIIEAEAICGKTGEQIRYCSACLEEEKEEIPALEHNYISTVIKEPTEEETGTRNYVCEFCNDSYTETIDKLPVSHKHNYISSVTTPATCNIAGVKTYTCSCDDSYTEPIPALTHSYSSSVTKEPTEQAEGIRTYTCSNCKDSYTEKIAKLPETHKHSYVESIIKQATCLDKGIKSFTCSCKDSYTEDIAALGHDMVDGKCRRCAYSEIKEDNTQGGANTTTPGAGNDTTTPDAGNNTTTPPAGNNTPTPDAGNNTTTPNAGNNTTTPDAGNNAPTPDVGNNTTTPDTGNNTTTPPANNTGATNNNANTSSNTDTNTNASTNTNNSTTNTNTTTDTTATSTVPSTNNNVTTGSTVNNTVVDNTTVDNTATDKTTETEDPEQTDHLVATLDMANNSVLYEDTLSVVRGQDVTVVLQMNEQVRWTIEGSNINDATVGIDMGVTLNNNTIPSDVMKQATKLSETNNVIEVSLAHDGPIEFAPVLTIETNKANAGRMATLFFFNPEKGELEFQDEVMIAEDGSISFTFNHASDYAIVISESSISNFTAITSTGALDINAPKDIDTDINQADANTNKDINNIASSLLITSEFSSTTFIIIIIALLLIVTAGIIVFIVSQRKSSSVSEEYEEYNNYNESNTYYDYDEHYDNDYDDNYDIECDDEYADEYSDEDYSDDYYNDYSDDYTDPISDK